MTSEQISEAQAFADVILTREWYGREITHAEAKREAAIAKQALADFNGGVPSKGSEAAQYFIRLNADIRD